MSDLAVSVTQICLLWLTATLAASVLSALCYPLYAGVMYRHGPRLRAAGTLVYGALPPLAATLVVVLLLQPGLSAALIIDHCHGADCTPHTPSIETRSFLGATLAATAMLVVMGCCVIVYRSLAGDLRRLRMLEALSDRAADSDFNTVDSADLLAWCGGLWRPKVYLSRGLLNRLNPRQLRVVLAHEHAHAARRDNLRRVILYWMTLFWPGELRARIRADFIQASEQVCDREAADRVGDTAQVAAVIELLGVFTDSRRCPRGSGFATGEWRSRVEALRCRQPQTGSFACGFWSLVVLLWILQVVLLTGVTHPLLEWITR